MLVVIGLLNLIAIGIGTMLINLSEGESTISMISFWIGILIILASLYFMGLSVFAPHIAGIS
jgi:hypothetical protein